MLTEQTGDILKITNGIICHQTNYHGTMGGGVAAGIAEKLLTPEQYKEYHSSSSPFSLLSLLKK